MENVVTLPDTPTLDVEVAERIAVVTINRPEVRNSLSRQVLDDLNAVLAHAEQDDAIGALVFTGAGDKAFAAGADITQLQNYTPASALESYMQRTYDAIEQFGKPTIAAVNGYALGGGCELAMSCDIRIASSRAKFGLPEPTLGVLPGAGGTQRLGRLVGVGRAIEMILTGRFADAEEALRIGLVTSIAEPGELLRTARETASTILAKGPLAVRLAKLVVRTGLDADQGTGLVVERLAQALLYGSSDKAEGAAAFLDKRTPEFKGE